MFGWLVQGARQKGVLVGKKVHCGAVLFLCWRLSLLINRGQQKRWAPPNSSNKRPHDCQSYSKHGAGAFVFMERRSDYAMHMCKREIW